MGAGRMVIGSSSSTATDMLYPSRDIACTHSVQKGYKRKKKWPKQSLDMMLIRV